MVSTTYEAISLSQPNSFVNNEYFEAFSYTIRLDTIPP